MKELFQVIVNTRGQARTLSQKRDARGRFLSGGDVSELSPVAEALEKSSTREDTVMVTHQIHRNNQIVMSINKKKRTGNAVTFLNDGLSTKLHKVF